MSGRYSTPHVHYPQLNPSRVCLPTNFQKFKCHIFICVWVFRFVSFRFCWFRFVSFSLISFRFVSFLFRFALYRCPNIYIRKIYYMWMFCITLKEEIQNGLYRIGIRQDTFDRMVMILYRTFNYFSLFAYILHFYLIFINFFNHIFVIVLQYIIWKQKLIQNNKSYLISI
jgi:hypothetical protein